MGYIFGQHSAIQLLSVKQPLREVALRALSKSRVDFQIVEGHRTAERQNWLYKSKERGEGWLTDKDGYIKIGKHQTREAIDFCPIIKGKLAWNDAKAFVEVGQAFKDAARELGIKINWGGDWSKRDLPHVELK